MPVHITPTVLSDYAKNFPKTYSVIRIDYYPDGGQPTPLWLGTVRTPDVYKLSGFADNDGWRRHVTPDTMITIIILCTGDIWECRRYADTLLREMKLPICNGYRIATAAHRATPIRCNNGEVYRSQTDAANQLGLSQAHISRHLNGGLKHVQGYTFEYCEKPLHRAIPTVHAATELANAGIVPNMPGVPSMPPQPVPVMGGPSPVMPSQPQRAAPPAPIAPQAPQAVPYATTPPPQPQPAPYNPAAVVDPEASSYDVPPDYVPKLNFPDGFKGYGPDGKPLT